MLQTNNFAQVNVSDFKVGATLQAPVYQDARGRELLLLAAGTRITNTLLAHLKRRGITQVRVNASELSRLTGQGSAENTSGRGQTNHRQPRTVRHVAPPQVAQVERQVGSRWQLSKDSFRHQLTRHEASQYQSQLADRCNLTYQKSIQEVSSMFQRVRSGNAQRVEEFETVSAELLLRLADDLDLFVGMGLNPARDQYPHKHSLQTMMVALSMGTVLGLPYPQLIELGIGCLLHDVGMLQIEKTLVGSRRRLTPLEFVQIKRHPIVSLDLLRKIPGVPHGVHMVVYQMHERCNGSGYPRGRNAGQIHPLAKIAAVADAFVAMISPRAHRPALLPYRAMEQILYETRTGLFDREVVRALLHTVSLFPTGSGVELNDGRVGKVLRANDADYMRPVVEICRSEASPVIDLSAQPGLQILRPLPDAALASAPIEPARSVELAT